MDYYTSPPCQVHYGLPKQGGAKGVQPLMLVVKKYNPLLNIQWMFLSAQRPVLTSKTRRVFVRYSVVEWADNYCSGSRWFLTSPPAMRAIARLIIVDITVRTSHILIPVCIPVKPPDRLIATTIFTSAIGIITHQTQHVKSLLPWVLDWTRVRCTLLPQPNFNEPNKSLIYGCCCHSNLCYWGYHNKELT